MHTISRGGSEGRRIPREGVDQKQVHPISRGGSEGRHIPREGAGQKQMRQHKRLKWPARVGDAAAEGLERGSLRWACYPDLQPAFAFCLHMEHQQKAW
eukprot:scaffold117969_cov19-Tisochrysis_lutea.AAC.3